MTTNTANGRAILQSDRNADLFIDVLRKCVAARRFQVHDFVVMPNHVHLLITISEETTIEKAMQFIKGGFSFRLKRETGYQGEVWQKGFSDHRIHDKQNYRIHREYIAQNPVKAGLAHGPNEFPWCFEALKRAKAAGAKAPLCEQHIRHD